MLLIPCPASSVLRSIGMLSKSRRMGLSDGIVLWLPAMVKEEAAGERDFRLIRWPQVKRCGSTICIRAGMSYWMDKRFPIYHVIKFPVSHFQSLPLSGQRNNASVIALDKNAGIITSEMLPVRCHRDLPHRRSR